MWTLPFDSKEVYPDLLRVLVYKFTSTGFKELMFNRTERFGNRFTIIACHWHITFIFAIELEEEINHKQ